MPTKHTNHSHSPNSFLPKVYHSAERTPNVRNVYARNTLRLDLIKAKKANSISKILKEVRNEMQANLQQEKSLEKLKIHKQQKRKKRQSYLAKKQKKIYFEEMTQPNQSEVISTRETVRKVSCLIPISVQVHEFKSLQKPPHRSSTFFCNLETAMCTDGQRIYVHGGLGCEPNLKLAVYDIDYRKWTFPIDENYAQRNFFFIQDNPTIPITGHSFGAYKGKGYVYGGKSTDVLNQLSILNFKDLKFTEGQRCQLRRKQHAMTFVSRFMIIQGGNSATEVSNQMFFYNIETNTWTYPQVSPTLPFLTNHSMTSTYPFKSKKKPINNLSEILDSIYIFGGQDKKGVYSNALYKVNYQNDMFNAVKVEMTGSIWPERRIQMAFHGIGSGYLLLYGGKLSQNWDSDNLYDRDDCAFAYHVQKQEWIKLPVSEALNDHYGMASSEYNGRVYIFGGIQSNRYTNGNVSVLNTWTSDAIRPKSIVGTRKLLRKETIL